MTSQSVRFNPARALQHLGWGGLMLIGGVALLEGETLINTRSFGADLMIRGAGLLCLLVAIRIAAWMSNPKKDDGFNRFTNYGIVVALLVIAVGAVASFTS